VYLVGFELLGMTDDGQLQPWSKSFDCIVCKLAFAMEG
jgi:hypothetical protein